MTAFFSRPTRISRDKRTFGMYMLYSLLTAAGMILLSPYFVIRGLLRGKDPGNIPERLGWKFPPGLRQALRGAREKQSGFTRFPWVKSSRRCPWRSN